MTSEVSLSRPRVLPVVLCGGSGTRLWPLSRKAMPKQFVPLLEGGSLIQLTLRRLKAFGTHAIAVGAEEHRFLIQEAFAHEGVEPSILLEPRPRNTAAAIAIAALSVEPDQLLLFCPADHHIADIPGFEQAVAAGMPAALNDQIVTFGVAPTYPSTAYGYIQIDQEIAAGRPTVDAIQKQSRIVPVKCFVEKPTETRARELLAQGGYFWNAGIFLVRAKALLAALEHLAADIHAACLLAMNDAARDGVFLRPHAEHFSGCRSESIDYAVLEKSDRVAMVPFSGTWSDVGSWKSVADLYAADAEGNRVSGQGYLLNARETFIHAAHRPVVAVGTQNLLIVDTPDAVLIADAQHSEQVKAAVSTLEQQGVAQAVVHREVARPWGSYDSIDQGERFQVKRITVKPGAKLSLQMHHHRAEHWIVVRGLARVTCGEKVFDLKENESTFIPQGVKHRLENPTSDMLELIEVQSGGYLGEDDIVRFEDHYGRI